MLTSLLMTLRYSVFNSTIKEDIIYFYSYISITEKIVNKMKNISSMMILFN